MKNCKVILMFLIGSMVCSVYACGKTEPGAFEFYNTENELIQEEASESEQIQEQASESEAIQGKEIREETEETFDWEQLLTLYIDHYDTLEEMLSRLQS